MTAPKTLRDLDDLGVSIWLDDLDRSRIESGNLAELVQTRAVKGVTTNPSIFHKAISSGGAAYADDLSALAAAGVDVDTAIRRLTTDDVRNACDIMRGVWDATDGVDGRVSIEVDPRLAHDTAGTIAQARELWSIVDRPNLLIKIPATKAGLPAITEVIGSGISVNVTLIFAVSRYREVVDAYMHGLKLAKANGHDLSTIHSVASFFVSRVDTEVDARLDAIGSDAAKAVRGKAALANARLAWEAHLDFMSDPEWQGLAVAGARPQRPLWASTGVKDPSYDDTRYVIDLAVRGCVNTMPEPTLNAVADHGVFAGDTISYVIGEAAEVWRDLAAFDIDAAEVCEKLEVNGVQQFIDAWESLRASVREALAS